MTKKIFATILLFVTIIAATVNVSADQISNDTIQPRYVGVASVFADLDISSSGRANAYGKVIVSPGYTVDMTVAIHQDSNGSIKSWSTSGSGILEINRNYYVASGHDYHVVVSVNVYNSSGRLVDTIDHPSGEVSY